MIILGIDPGSRHTGYGLVHAEGGRDVLVAYGVLHLDGHDSHELRLKHIYDRLEAVIDRHLPDECAIEMPVYGNNAQSMLKLGRAQAVAMLAALNHQVPVTQYTPKEVKKSVTGNGNASKDQVLFMVRTLLGITEDDEHTHEKLLSDSADALAVSLCHAHRLSHGATHKFKNWKSFVQANPGRVAR